MKKLFFAIALLWASAVQATIGVWADQGTVASTISGHHIECHTVLFESGCLIVASPCFKLWTSTTFGPHYAESTNGTSWSSYASNPIISLGGGTQQYETKVHKEGSTYYLYTGPIPGGPIAVYTSTDGVTFTLQNSTAIAVGSVGQLDHFWAGQLAVVDVVSGTWYAYYAGQQVSGGGYSEILATSPDGINWTKDYTNTQTQYGPSNFEFHKVNSRYYGWSQVVIPGIPVFAGLGLPSDIMRRNAATPTGPWAPFDTATFYRTQTSEGVGLTTGQVADPTIVEALGNVYIFFTAKSAGQLAGNGVLNCAIASSTTLSALVLTHEGVVNVPIPGTGGFELNGMTNPLATDNFNRANVNPIGGNWTSLGGIVGNAQIVSNSVQNSVAGTSGDSFWNANTFSNDQWATDAITSFSGSASFAGVILRGSSQNAYRVFMQVGSPGNFIIAKIVANAASNLTNQASPDALVTGDTITGSVVGTQISFFKNRNLLWTLTDSSLSSGKAGFQIDGVSSTANAQIDNWSGGNITAAPPASILFLQRHRK